MNSIEYITCPNGDWKMIMVDGEEYESAHSISDSAWISLIKETGVDVKSTEISDEEMEELSRGC